ncbi:hypothetical protein ACHAWX_007451 [Stephanocyclus meneghinianus]
MIFLSVAVVALETDDTVSTVFGDIFAVFVAVFAVSFTESVVLVLVIVDNFVRFLAGFTFDGGLVGGTAVRLLFVDRGEDLDIGIDLLDDVEATGWESLEDLGGRFVTLFAFEECSLRVTLRSFLPRDSEQARVDTSTTFLTAEGMLFSSTEQDAATLGVDFLERSRLGKNSSSDNAPESSSSSDMACNGRSAAAGIGDVAVITSIDTFGINILSSTSSGPLLDSKLAALHSLGVVSFIFLAGLPVFTVAADIKSLGESILSSI